MSVLKIKVENILLCHKSTEQDKSLYMLYRYSTIEFFTFMLPCIVIDFFLITNQTH